MSKFLNTSEFIIMINSRHILNLSIELIIKPQALDKTFCYKCNVGVDKRRTDGRPRTADRGRRTADRGRRTADRGPRTADRGAFYKHMVINVLFHPLLLLLLLLKLIYKQ